MVDLAFKEAVENLSEDETGTLLTLLYGLSKEELQSVLEFSKELLNRRIIGH